MGNIFEHDAVATWSGFVYQGRIAAYLAVKKIYELSVSEKEGEIQNYYVEMEKCEDISFLYKDGDGEKYESIHQVKNQADRNISNYRGPLTQLMLEKGYYVKNNLGNPEAFLHVSNPICFGEAANLKNIVKQWYCEVKAVFENLCSLQEKLKTGKNLDATLGELANCGLGKIIKIERAEYTKLRKSIKEACDKKDSAGAERALDLMICFLKENLYVCDINENVELFTYDDGEDYCSGTKIFSRIVDCVRKYKGENAGLSKGQLEYIADVLLCFVNDKILTRHKLLQEKKNAFCTIPLYEFENILNDSLEKYEEEVNILALMRIYDDCLEQYCEICLDENENNCNKGACKLQSPDYRKNILERDNFIRMCYNLNPECDKRITNRDCLAGLLMRDGMLESVFPAIKEIPGKYFIKETDKTFIAVMNERKNAFITAITNSRATQTVKNIIKAMESNRDLIETIFDADQLVTSRLNASSTVWDNSCIAIQSDELEENDMGYDDEKHSIYVAKKPQFVEFKQFYEEVKGER